MGLSKGAVIAGRYRAERCVGAGGMGEVWEGEHVTLGSRVAIKTLLAGGEDNPELVARFRREAKLLGRCRSDHVARVVDFVQDPEHGLVLVMEFVEGRSLSSILESKTLSIDEGLDLAIDLASALADLHRAKIVHRDIKPGNIIMHPQPSGGSRAVLVDFGISRIEGADEEHSLTGITRADIALGTVEYMAPEQILNSRQVTAASDVYAVGAILFRALSGRHVFGDRRDEALARAKLIDEPPPLAVGGRDPVAEGLCAVVDRALKKRPAQRIPSGEQMLELLLPLKDLRRQSDLDDETTADGERTLARDLSVPDPRASLPSIPPAPTTIVRPEPEVARRSLPGVELPSTVEARPRVGSLAGEALEPPRPRLPWGTLALAIATAFAVGAAVAVALVPPPEPTAVAATPSASATPPPADAPPPAAVTAAPCPAPAATIDLDEPDAVVAAAPSSAPKPPPAPPKPPPAALPAPPPPKPPPPAAPPGSAATSSPGALPPPAAPPSTAPASPPPSAPAASPPAPSTPASPPPSPSPPSAPVDTDLL